VSADFYLWGAYLVTFALLAAEVILLARRARKGK
jgi:heme exporter protein CcmD